MGTGDLLMPALAVALCALFVLKMNPASPGEFPEWMHEAAQESARAAQVSCSNHGRVFERACECHPCFTGSDCSQEVQDCPVDVDGGDPTFLERFWIEHAKVGGVFTPSWYRLSYTVRRQAPLQLVSLPVQLVTEELEASIRQLHQLVGNAVTKDRYIVVGTGSMQLVSAALNALSANAAQQPALVVARAPYYMVYKMQLEVLSSTRFTWAGDAVKALENGVDPSSVIELAASPNNPDTAVQDPVFRGTKAQIIHDKAYYWPHFTPVTHPTDEDVMLFSLSKFTGHAGTRVGWAIVKDVEVYQRMMFYVLVTTIGVSYDSQRRAMKLIKTVVESYNSSSTPMDSKLFHYGYQLMQSRWQRISEAFKGSSRFSLQETQPRHCSFFDQELQPSPAYAWIRCERPEPRENCHQVFKSAGILGRPGAGFGVEDHFVRLSLVQRESVFERLLGRIKLLVSGESTEVVSPK